MRNFRRWGSTWGAALGAAFVVYGGVGDARPAGADGNEQATGYDQAIGYEQAITDYVTAAAQALLDRSEILVVGRSAAQRTEVANGIVYTLNDLVVTSALRGAAPSVLTIRSEGGVLPDGQWQDYQSFALPDGVPVVVPLRQPGTQVGIDPADDLTHLVDQGLLGHLLGVGALLAVDESLPLLPTPSCDLDSCEPPVAPGQLADWIAAEVIRLYEAAGGVQTVVDETLNTLLESVEMPGVTTCGRLADESDASDDTVCGSAGGGGGAGQYTVVGYWESRYLPARYTVWNNTPDVIGEEAAVRDGADDWAGTWWRSDYAGVASGPESDEAGLVLWTTSDIDGLARVGSNGGDHGATGFTIYLGDQYRWSIGASYGAYDIATAIRHEMGHVLGLGHSSYRRNVMFPSLPPATVKLLGSGDMAGLRWIYPYDDYRAVLVAAYPPSVSVLRGTGSAEVAVEFKNIGRTPWHRFRDITLVAAPVGRCSVFDGSGPTDAVLAGVSRVEPWISCFQPVVRLRNVDQQMVTVERYEVGHAVFRFNAPLTASPGTYVEEFLPDIAGSPSVVSNDARFEVRVV